MQPPGPTTPAPRPRRARALLRTWFVAATLALPTLAQVDAGPRAAPRPGVLTPLDGGQLAALSLSSGRLLDHALPARLDGPLDLPLHLDGVTHTLQLRPASLRAPDFRLLLSDADGALVPALAPPSGVVRGAIAGLPDSAAAGALVDGELRLVLRTAPDAEPWAVDTLPDGRHALYPLSAVVGEDGACGTFAPHAGGAAAFLPPAGAEGEALVAELAIDADFEYYALNGSSVPATVADVEAVIAATEMIYSADVDVTYELTSITVRTSASDPYTSSDPNELLDEFRAHWNAEQSAIPRDLAHLFTGRDLVGSTIGLAFVNVVCHGSAHYGLSQSRYTTNFSRRVALTAHELGHNWSAQHCDGDVDCAIMCPVLGGCTGVLDAFGTSSLASIGAKKSASSCLAPAVSAQAPVLQSVSPVFGAASGGSTLELHGLQFPTDPAPLVYVGGAGAAIEFAGETLLQVTLPPGPPGADVDVRVVSADGVTQLDDAFHYAAEIVGGDKALGELDADDVEPLLLDAPAGARLTARIVPLDPLGGLLPGLRLLGPDDEVLAQLDAPPAAAGKPLTLSVDELPESGAYRLDAYAQSGSAGAYKLLTKLKPAKKHKPQLSVTGDESEPSFTFSAAAGSQLALARFKALKPKGAFALVDDEPSALLPALLELVGPEGPIDLEPFLETAKSGKWQRVRKLPLPALGEYTLTVGGASGSVGHGRLLLKLKPPPKPKQLHELGD